MLQLASYKLSHKSYGKQQQSVSSSLMRTQISSLLRRLRRQIVVISGVALALWMLSNSIFMNAWNFNFGFDNKFEKYHLGLRRSQLLHKNVKKLKTNQNLNTLFRDYKNVQIIGDVDTLAQGYFFCMPLCQFHLKSWK